MYTHLDGAVTTCRYDEALVEIYHIDSRAMTGKDDTKVNLLRERVHVPNSDITVLHKYGRIPYTVNYQERQMGNQSSVVFTAQKRGHHLL